MIFYNFEKIEKTYSDSQSSLILNAYRVLQDDLERGIYILKTSKYEKTLDDDNHIDDLAFLANIMELNEKLVELSSPDDVMQFEMEINKEIEERKVPPAVPICEILSPHPRTFFKQNANFPFSSFLSITMSLAWQKEIECTKFH